ncbi:methyltransferase-like [Tropilaelaps mercedesae]|uniref:Methyltransferase-like n=1 Tax=Tropilaelaps mercedesae TaxID=418985 RepID=A0A1V9X0Z1_9ACAR|nr:methyltransferase-like [Tropilaelaps mercedesae]
MEVKFTKSKGLCRSKGSYDSARLEIRALESGMTTESSRASMDEDAKSPIRKVRITPGKSETNELAQGCFEDLWKHMGGNVTLEETRRYYDLMACHFDEEMADQQYNGPQIVVDKLAELGISKDARILDVGCGTGLLGKALSEAGFSQVDGVDMSEEMLRQAEKKSVYLKTLLLAVEPEADLSPINGDPYDAICLLSSFQPGHVSPLALEKLAMLLRPGGKVVWARSSSIPPKHLTGPFQKEEWLRIKDGLSTKGLQPVEEGTVERFNRDRPGLFGIFLKN